MACYIINKVHKWVRWIVPICLLAFFPVSLSAQVGEYRNNLAVGFNAGYMLSNVTFTPEVPQNYLGGVTGGLSLRYTSEKYFNSICALVMEVNYAQAGWNENILDQNDERVYYVDDVEKTDPLYYKRRLTYIQVPFLARMGWGRERKGFQFFFQIGPQVGCFLNESTDCNIREGVATQTQRVSPVVAQESMAVEKKVDYGISGGIGLEYSHPKIGHFLIEGRYYFGLGNIYGNSKSDYFAKSNQSSIIVKDSYLFDIMKTKNSKIK